MKFNKFLIATCFAACMSATAQAAEIGVINFTFDAPNRDRIVQALVTFPAEGGGFPESVGDNPVFKGVMLRRDAKPERKRHPLIIFSHGSGGNAANASWLTKRLAEEGYVVIAPSHQGSTSGDSRPETTIPATWERKRDMSALLNAIEHSPSLGRLVDLNNVTAIGFSLGGHTVLGLVGAELRAKSLAANCDSDAAAPGCTWLKQGNYLIKGHVDLHKIDESKFNTRYVDPRIKRVIAIDPAFVPAYDAQSIKEIHVPVGLINLGSPGKVPAGIDAEPLANLVTSAQFARVENSDHFSFLAECKMFGGLMIWMEGDDPVCSETSNRARADIHTELAEKVIAQLKALSQMPLQSAQK